jgi:hypothetical protein
MWPYILMCLGWNTCVVLIAALAHQRWGLTSPGFVGFLSASISIVAAGWFFFQNHHRRFLPVERRRFAFGCFFAFWFYDEFLRIAFRAAHSGINGKGAATAIVATLVDFALVWIVVMCLDIWAVRTYGSTEDEPPPNQRLERP